jgi:hypothetical protein
VSTGANVVTSSSCEQARTYSPVGASEDDNHSVERPTNSLKKKDLQKHLREALDAHLPISVLSPFEKVKNKTKKAKKQSTGLDDFAPGAYWKTTVPNEVPVTEPINTVPGAQAPTVPADEAYTVPPKHNFLLMFDREVFLGHDKVPAYHDNGKTVRDSMKKLIFHDVPRIKG